MDVQSSRHLLYLMACGLNQWQPQETVLEGLDFEILYKQAGQHSVTALVGSALEHTRLFEQAEPELREKFQNRKNQAIRRRMLFDAERRAVSETMETRGIWHVALKGSVLQDMYPKYGIREMADVDMLIDPDMREEARDIFLERGYRVESYGEDIHDVYCKPPIYNFEIHDALFQPCYPGFAAYYETIREKLLPVEGRKFELRFSPEDFYVFFEAHAYKHYHLGGTGIRTLADQYILDMRLGSSLNRAYVDGELERLGILGYERESQTLAEKLFGTPEPRLEILTEEETRVVNYYLGSSTYGTSANAMRNRLQTLQGDSTSITGATKFRYLLRRLFPGRETYRNVYPLLYHCPVLLPFYWIWRMITKGLLHLKRNLREWFWVKES